MNQILDYSPNKGERKSSGSDKIVHFFAVIMIIFAIVLIVGAGYNLYQNNKDDKKATVEEEKAKIEVAQQEAQAVIKVTHTKVVEKIIYSWNNGKETTIKSAGQSIVEQPIPLPAGENTLHIKVIDIDGGEATYEGTFTSVTGEDILNPVIKLEVTDEKKLRITATDETSLDFITYRWNNEEETQVKATEDEKKKIVVEIEILKGVNDLVISAVDSNNNTTLETKSFTGLTKPEVMIVVAADKKTVEVTVKHDQGLKEIKLTLNDVEYPVSLPEENAKEMMFNVQLLEGVNKMTVTATSVDDTQTVATEEVDNTPEQPTEEEPSEENPTEEQPEVEEPTSEEVQISIEKTDDGQSAYYKASHPSGIKEIKLNVNEMDLDLSALGELGVDTTNIEFLVPLYDGNNRITFTVIPVEGTEKQEVKEIVK